MTDVSVNVHHVTRLEGHGNIVVDIRNGALENCRFDVVEAPRFFEVMLRGRSYLEASHVASRICGICAVGHATASLRATESALGIEVSPQTTLLRELNMLGEILDSHVLHVYMLVAPDLLGQPSVLSLAKSAPDVVRRALRLKQLAGDLCRALCGRHTHPLGMTVGGFSMFPDSEELEALLGRFVNARHDVDATVELFRKLTFPAFDRETEYIALWSPNRYTFLDGEIASSLGEHWPLDRYLEVTNERPVAPATSKRTSHARSSYMVGALSRFKTSHASLHPRAAAAAADLGLTPDCCNPFFNTVAQVVEIAHAIESAIELLKPLLHSGVVPEEPVQPARLSGSGVGACEVPRGTLFHAYQYQDGRMQTANCVVPTGQNIGNLEEDMRAFVPRIVEQPEDSVRLNLEMLARAYDPCISCATHLVKVRFHP